LLILVISCQNVTILSKKNFGQKNVVLAHSEGCCDAAKTSFHSIFKHSDLNWLKYE
jgi:hypothetical protein